METIKYTGKLQRYFRAPIYMIFLFVAGDVFVFLQNIKVGALFSICIVVYAAIVLWFYRSCSAKLEEEIIHFATHYGTVQKKLLNEFQLPYALMDYSGKILWVNEEFSRVTGRDKNYNKSITSIFKEITREEIEKAMEVYRKNQCIVISDEIWSDLTLNGHKHTPTQSVSEDAKNRTIAFYAPSKTFNLAGLIGSYHIIYNPFLRDLVQNKASKSQYNEMNVLSMHALIGAYQPEGAE